MESRIHIFLLSLFLSIFSLPAMAADNADETETSDAPPEIISPDIDRRKIKEPRIDSENFEVGAYFGLMSVEDFGVNSVAGVRFAYHVTEGFFVEGAYGQTQAEKTSYELLSGAAELLTDDERDFKYYNLSFGYNVLPGEAFVGRKRALTSALYFVAGAGSTEFAGDDRFTINVGAGTRVLLTDWLALHADVRDHLFDSDLFGESKTTHNIEFHIGLTGFF